MVVVVGGVVVPGAAEAERAIGLTVISFLDTNLLLDSAWYSCLSVFVSFSCVAWRGWPHIEHELLFLSLFLLLLLLLRGLLCTVPVLVLGEYECDLRVNVRTVFQL